MHHAVLLRSCGCRRALLGASLPSALHDKVCNPSAAAILDSCKSCAPDAVLGHHLPTPCEKCTAVRNLCNTDPEVCLQFAMQPATVALLSAQHFAQHHTAH